MRGDELRQLRRIAGLSQVALARRAGLSRDTLSYWENKSHVNLGSGSIRRILSALGEPALRNYRESNARAGGWGLSRNAEIFLSQERHLAARIEAQAAARRVRCGARTRKGAACRNKSEPGKTRCKFHGGKSTGPKTAKGKKRISLAQKKRWAEWRKEVCAKPDSENSVNEEISELTSSAST